MGIVLCAINPDLQILDKLTPDNIPNNLLNFLIDNILSKQAPKLRNFLYKLLILDEIELPLIITLAEDEDRSRVLVELFNAISLMRKSNRN